MPPQSEAVCLPRVELVEAFKRRFVPHPVLPYRTEPLAQYPLGSEHVRFDGIHRIAGNLADLRVFQVIIEIQLDAQGLPRRQRRHGLAHRPRRFLAKMGLIRPRRLPRSPDLGIERNRIPIALFRIDRGVVRDPEEPGREEALAP